MPAEYLLSVDLGTSHTVAMVVWPDGRTRPLLFDGSPVMPSAVFLDEAGTIHTGRDAERLGPTAPERLEPNPKQKVSGGTILLGDRELDVRDAFAAILSRVGAQCAEAAGGVPRTVVLTCPAAWSEQRRAALQDAAARAGYPPVQLISEPVAAAHYYTSRLDHPINPGQAIAVFDFGGGTLDIAVVERRPDGEFAVLADGGLPDLGGLDFDAALVAHLGETIDKRDPEVWKRLENPSGASEQRDRRALWKDVREAKEMLSRSSVAPVTVPGLEQALHLTRGELDQLSAPLLGRAVGETQRVVGLTGRNPAQLAGVFLVGGSSRMPLVSKVLHEQLGIAPTVLEQPELPVSEGAALGLAAPAPVTPPAMSPPVTAQQSPAGSLPPQTPTADQTIQLRHSGADKQRKRKRAKWIAIAAGALALIIALPLLWWYLTNPYKQRDFLSELETVGDPIATAGADGAFYDALVRGDKTLFAYSAEGGTDGELHLLAVDTATGEALWDDEAVIPRTTWGGERFWVSEELLVLRQETDEGYAWTFVDWSNGEVLNTVEGYSEFAERVGDDFVIETAARSTLTVYDADGQERSTWEVGDREGDVTIHTWDSVESAEDLVAQSEPFNSDGRIFALTSDGVAHVYDTGEGKTIAERELETPDDYYYAYNGLMYVAADKNTGYELSVYDIDDGLNEVHRELIEGGEEPPDRMVPCGEERVCVGTSDPEATDVYSWHVFDAEQSEIVHTFDDQQYGWIEGVGDRLLVEYYEGDTLRTQVYDKDFETVGNSLDETYDGIDGGSALAFPLKGDTTVGEVTANVIGLGARDGSRHSLRAELVAFDCAPTDTHLACITPDGMQVFKFRDE